MVFEDLNAFFHVASNESFSRAATEMRIAQSALSRRVQRLEHQLGLKLLERWGRGVRLTEAGRLLMARTEFLLREIDTVEADMQSLALQPTGKVRIALPPTTGQVLAPLLVADCRRLFPGIALYLREGLSGFIHEWIVRDEIDIALLYNPEGSAELEITPILDAPLHLIAPGADRAIGHDGPLTPAQLFELPLILPQRPHSLRLLVDRYALEHGRRLNVVNEVDGVRTTKALVEAGLGYTIFSYAGMYEELSDGRLRAIPLAPPLSWRLSMVRRKEHRTSRAILEVKTLIERQIGTLLERGLWEGNAVLPALQR